MKAFPTCKLRFEKRKRQMSSFYRGANGGPAFHTYTVLQQWWADGTHIDTHGTLGEEGEWRDVEQVDEKR